MLNKNELIAKVSERSETTKSATERVLASAIDVITEALRNGDKVSVNHVGLFKVQHRNPRIGRNPHTGEPVEIPAKDVIKFKPSKALNERIQRS